MLLFNSRESQYLFGVVRIARSPGILRVQETKMILVRVPIVVVIVAN